MLFAIDTLKSLTLKLTSSKHIPALLRLKALFLGSAAAFVAFTMQLRPLCVGHMLSMAHRQGPQRDCSVHKIWDKMHLQ